MTDRRKLIEQLKSAKKKFYCTGCGIKMTVLVSLNCNCGGNIKEIGEISNE